MFIDNDDKKLFRKRREIRIKINKLIYLNNAEDFVETTFDDGDEFYYGRCTQKYKPC